MTAISATPSQMSFSRIRFSHFIGLLVIALLGIWTAVPLFMALMWSLVDPDQPWSPPAVLPPSLSLAQWEYVLKFSDIEKAVLTSFALAPVVTVVSFILAFPTAYAIARHSFRGKELLRVLILLPIILPAMVTALFLSRVFYLFDLAQSFLGLIIGHTLLSMPYMLRILATALEAIPQDILDAARNLGAGWITLVYRVIIPMILPGLFAGAVFTFITSLEEFNLTFVIGTPTFQTIPTVLFDYLGYHFVRTNAAVVAIILMVPSIAILFVTERFLKTEYLSSAFGKF